MIEHNHLPLTGDYTYAHLDTPAFRSLFMTYRPLVFGNTLTYQPDEVYSDEEIAAIREIQRPFIGMYRLQLGVFHQRDTVAGWTVGWQSKADTFYMANTGILPEHQRKGIYTSLLPELLDILGRRGFQVVESRHTATNNHVIIPKLRAGFVITGMEVSDQFGTLVWLSYFFNPVRRRMMDVRTGELMPDDEIRLLLGL